MRMLTAFVCLVVMSATVPGAARQTAPPGMGGIGGVVVDVAGGVLPGATVELQGGVSRATVSGGDGRFAFAAVPVGHYTVTAHLAGFVPVAQPVQVGEGTAASLTLTLAVAPLTEAITVTGASPTIDAQRSGGREEYERLPGHGFRRTALAPLSTFSIDVDTASYANVRRFLRDGTLPPPEAVRVEELVNYFRYDYAAPVGDTPFGVTTEYTVCPWNSRHRLALVGLRGREVPAAATPPRNLVFLVDVSGSMDVPDKLPLVRQGLRLLTQELTEHDRVAIVVYAGASGVVLPSTPGHERARILSALDGLEAGGSTNGGAGITLAYREARDHFIRGGINRVILATDGDFNVGLTSRAELDRLIEREREGGVFLSVLGVGRGNLKDATMESLADKGNGNYSYIDSLHEARKVLVEEAGSTLVTIAKDVKVQVEFNPAVVSAYRLVGYENRVLRDEEFTDDRRDAGEIGAGHTVTALYEIVPAGVAPPEGRVEPLRYRAGGVETPRFTNEAMTVRLRYKAPDGATSRPLRVVVPNRTVTMSANAGFASAVAEFALVLRGAAAAERVSLARAAERARRYRGEDVGGYRAEFLQLADLAADLQRLAAGYGR